MCNYDSYASLVDDYYVDPFFKNDHQLLFQIELSGTQLKQIILYPVFIEYGQTKLSNENQFTFIAERMKILCEEMGTQLKRRDQQSLEIDIDR
jgi:hypothetical protein